MSALDPYVTAFYRQSIGRPFDAAYADFSNAFATNNVLLQTARTELTELTARGVARNDFQGDHEGKIRARVLSRMLAQFDARKG